MSGIKDFVLKFGEFGGCFVVVVVFNLVVKEVGGGWLGVVEDLFLSVVFRL